MPDAPPPAAADRGRVTAALATVTDAQTYRNVLYLAVSFPLGLLYYILLSFGFAVGVALSVVLVGLAVLFGTVLAARRVAAFERRLANRLLATDIPTPPPVDTDTGGVVQTTKAYVRAGSTWRGLGFVALKFPLGVLSFVVLVSLLGVAAELVLLPVVPGGALNTQVAGWRVTDTFASPTRRLVAVPLGAVLGVVGLNVVNAFADATASIAASLLGPAGDAGGGDGPAADGDPATGDSAAAAGGGGE
jgi:hypothetical protein